MNPLREMLYDRVKDRRYGRLFLICFLGVIGLLLILRTGEELLAGSPTRFGEMMIALLPVLALVLALRAGMAAFYRRRSRDPGYDCSQLSGDELIKARSKLLRRSERKDL